MVKFLQSINLAFEHFFLGFSLDGFDVNNFDGDRLLIFLVDAPVDDGAETLSDDVLEAIRVVLDFFSEIIIGIELAIHCSLI